GTRVLTQDKARVADREARVELAEDLAAGVGRHAQRCRVDHLADRRAGRRCAVVADTRVTRYHRVAAGTQIVDRTGGLATSADGGRRARPSSTPSLPTRCTSAILRTKPA